MTITENGMTLNRKNLAEAFDDKSFSFFLNLLEGLSNDNAYLRLEMFRGGMHFKEETVFIMYIDSWYTMSFDNKEYDSLSRDSILNLMDGISKQGWRIDFIEFKIK
jgi:hypothetical protein